MEISPVLTKLLGRVEEGDTVNVKVTIEIPFRLSGKQYQCLMAKGIDYIDQWEEGLRRAIDKAHHEAIYSLLFTLDRSPNGE